MDAMLSSSPSRRSVSPRVPRARLVLGVAVVAAALSGGVAAALPAAPVPVLGPVPAPLPTPDELRDAELLSVVNAERALAGLPTLVADPELTAVARQRAVEMAAEGLLAHTPDLTERVPEWQRLAENVGLAGDVPAVHGLFVDSSPHLANILDPVVNQVGIGTYVDGNGWLWAVEVFVQR